MLTFANIRGAYLIIIVGFVLFSIFIAPLHWIFYLVPTLFFLFFLFFGSSTLEYNFFANSYTQPTVTNKQIALTFDDGPTPYTKEVLGILRKHNAKATFFCIGKQIEQYPEIFKKIIAEGHTVGNHSYSHSNFFPFFSSSEIAREINKTNELIHKYSGINTNLFRPPFGVCNPAIAKAVKKCKMLIIGWNLRSYDTVAKDQTKLTQKIKSRVKPGTILLLHDNNPDAAKTVDDILVFTTAENYGYLDIKRIFEI